MKVSSSQLLLASIVAIAAVVSIFWSGGVDKPNHLNEHSVIGVVALSSVDDNTFAGFKEGMESLGYIEGENVTYLVDGPAGEISRLDGSINGYLKRGADLIFVSSTPGTMAVQRATRENRIPVVFAPVNDPVGAGVVKTLEHPGENITGIKLPTGDRVRLQWLKKISPTVTRVYVPYNPNDKSALASLAQAEKAASTLGMQLVKGEVMNPGGKNRTIGVIPDNIDAIFVPRDSSIEAMIDEIVTVSQQRKLPVSAPSLTQVHAGALYTYGFIHQKFGKQASRLVDSILRGADPSDIPVEIAQSYLAINIQTAKELDIEIAGSVLRQADIIVRE